jgi:hypothetical protein
VSTSCRKTDLNQFDLLLTFCPREKDWWEYLESTRRDDSD